MYGATFIYSYGTTENDNIAKIFFKFFFMLDLIIQFLFLFYFYYPGHLNKSIDTIALHTFPYAMPFLHSALLIL